MLSQLAGVTHPARLAGRLRVPDQFVLNGTAYAFTGTPRFSTGKLNRLLRLAMTACERI